MLGYENWRREKGILAIRNSMGRCSEEDKKGHICYGVQFDQNVRDVQRECKKKTLERQAEEARARTAFMPAGGV